MLGSARIVHCDRYTAGGNIEAKLTCPTYFSSTLHQCRGRLQISRTPPTNWFSSMKKFELCFYLSLVIIESGCGSSVFATSLEHPETGDVFLCRTDSPAMTDTSWQVTGSSSRYWDDSSAQSAHDSCIRQLQGLGYEIVRQSDSVR